MSPLSWILGTTQPQRFLHIAQQIRLLVRLAEITFNADLERALTMLLAGTRRYHDDGYQFETRIVFHVGGAFVAVHAWHFDVEQHDVGHFVLRFLGGLWSILAVSSFRVVA